MICRVMVVLPEDSGPKISIDASARNAADAECGVEGDGAGGDDGDRHDGFFRAEAHDGTFAELLFQLGKRCIDCSTAFCDRVCHVNLL